MQAFYYHHEWVASILKEFNYFDESLSDGIILRKAVQWNFVYYFQMMYKDGLDCNMYNRKMKGKRKTPLDIAEKENYFSIYHWCQI